MFARLALFTAALALSAAAALANDTMAELKTGGLDFVRSNDVSMEKEDLFVSQEEIRVDYVFKNNSASDIESVVAFPMPDITGGGYQNIAIDNFETANILDFSVKQDGRPIKTELQQRAFATTLDVTDELVANGISLLPFSQATAAAIARLPDAVKKDWESRGIVRSETIDQGKGVETVFTPVWTLKSTYWWKTIFPAGKQTGVSHRYKPSVGGTVAVTFVPDETEGSQARYREYQSRYCIDDALLKVGRQSAKDMVEGKPFFTEAWISYILMTGNNWDGPIASFKLTVDKGSPKNYVSFCGTGVRKTGPTTFEMMATDFYPDKDLDILILKASNEE